MYMKNQNEDNLHVATYILAEKYQILCFLAEMLHMC